MGPNTGGGRNDVIDDADPDNHELTIVDGEIQLPISLYDRSTSTTCFYHPLSVVVPTQPRRPFDLFLFLWQQFRFQRSKTRSNKSVQTGVLGLVVSNHPCCSTKPSCDSHYPRPCSYTSHHPYIRPERYHRATQHRTQHPESGRIQLGPELHRTHGEYSDRESEPPEPHIEPDPLAAHQVEDGGCREDEPDESEAPDDER
jgi:hypothetical protein